MTVSLTVLRCFATKRTREIIHSRNCYVSVDQRPSSGIFRLQRMEQDDYDGRNDPKSRRFRHGPEPCDIQRAGCIGRDVAHRCYCCYQIR